MIIEILPQIHMIKNYSNSYVIQFKDHCVLIDCGMDKKAKEILEAIEKTGKELKTILITHGHLDHINGLARIKERFPKAIVASSEEDKNAVEGKKTLLPKGFKGFIYRFLSIFIKYKGVKVDKTLREGKFENFEVISTPGHTKGSLSFLLKVEGRNVLFVGDLVLNKENKLSLAPDEFNFDRRKIIESLKKISKIKVDYLFSGHGEVVKENVNEKLNKFISFLE